MPKHFSDGDGYVHCVDAREPDRTLCGLAFEGDDGNQKMDETMAGIDCDTCIRIIEYCKRVRSREIKPSFERRRAGWR